MSDPRQRALLDLRLARESWREARPQRVSPTDSVSQAQGMIGKPHRDRYLFARARRALGQGARLESTEHDDLIEEVKRVKDIEAIPDEVLAYLAQIPRRGRPRRLATVDRNATAAHIIWLLRGYYKRKRARLGIAQPLARAKEAAAQILGMKMDTIDDCWKANRLPPW